MNIVGREGRFCGLLRGLRSRGEFFGLLGLFGASSCGAEEVEKLVWVTAVEEVGVEGEGVEEKELFVLCAESAGAEEVRSEDLEDCF